MHRIAICALLTLILGVPARAQFTQYSAPGSAVDIPEDPAQAADQAAESARWRFGRLRLQPHLTLTDIGYVDNVFSAPEGSRRVNDSHATLGAGLSGYIRLGAKSLLSGYITPRYYWWQDSRELRESTLSSGLAWFGDFNRLQLAAIARDSSSQKPLSFEVEAPVSTSEEDLGLDSTLAITRSLAIFTNTTHSRARHGREIEQFVAGLSLRSLDRNSKRQTLGFEVRGKDIEFGLGYERTEVDFLDSDERDNTGTGPLVRLSYKRARLQVEVEYSDLDFDFETPAKPNSKQVVGSASVAFHLRPRTEAHLYFSDRLAFTTISTEGIIESENRGLAVTQSFSDRLEASVFGETGTQTFDDPQNIGRADDLEAFGLSLRYDLSELLTLTATVRDEQWNSTSSNFDRSSSSFGIGVEVGGNLLPW